MSETLDLKQLLKTKVNNNLNSKKILQRNNNDLLFNDNSFHKLNLTNSSNISRLSKIIEKNEKNKLLCSLQKKYLHKHYLKLDEINFNQTNLNNYKNSTIKTKQNNTKDYSKTKITLIEGPIYDNISLNNNEQNKNILLTTKKMDDSPRNNVFNKKANSFKKLPLTRDKLIQKEYPPSYYFPKINGLNKPVIYNESFSKSKIKRKNLLFIDISKNYYNQEMKTLRESKFITPAILLGPNKYNTTSNNNIQWIEKKIDYNNLKKIYLPFENSVQRGKHLNLLRNFNIIQTINKY